MKLKLFLKLVRFEHALMLAIAVLIGETLVLGGIPLFSHIIILSLLVPIFSEMGSFALNDYLDIKTDKLNKRLDRPLVTGEISPIFAYLFGWFSIIISVTLSYFINFNVFVIALIFNILAILYNYFLKDLPLVGNFYIALTMAIPFIFGNFVITNILFPITIILSLLGFVSGLAREIIKSVQDMGGDLKARKSKTLPILIGESKSRKIASFLYLLFIPLTILPFYYGLRFNYISAGLIALVDIGLLAMILKIWHFEYPEVMAEARKSSLIYLFVGLIALLLAVIF